MQPYTLPRFNYYKIILGYLSITRNDICSCSFRNLCTFFLYLNNRVRSTSLYRAALPRSILASIIYLLLNTYLHHEITFLCVTNNLRAYKNFATYSQ